MASNPSSSKQLNVGQIVNPLERGRGVAHAGTPMLKSERTQEKQERERV
ncbi:hypothetical protein A2U01_0091341, partial [Trifolium medium]|nr:hypothetical protein [Trifolium medium]